MAVSKRVRFEVLRRDDNTCQYCGGKAPDVRLTVDHVMPAALGGSDFPDNLVAACEDCNAGKTSITPESPLVEKVQGAAAEFAVKSTQAAARLRAEFEGSAEYVEEFHDHWAEWTSNGEVLPLPVDWRSSVRQWWRIGVPEELLEEAIDIAMTKGRLRKSDFPEFRYMAGIVWTKLEQAGIGADASSNEPRLYTENEKSEYGIESYEHGWKKGFSSASNAAFRYMDAMDSVALHVDRRGEIWPMVVNLRGS